jgi:hypothetical protein
MTNIMVIAFLVQRLLGDAKDHVDMYVYTAKHPFPVKKTINTVNSVLTKGTPRISYGSKLAYS